VVKPATAEYNPEADEEEQRCVRFVGKRGGLRVSLTQSPDAEVDDAQLNAVAIAVVIDSIYEISKQFPETLEGTAITLGNINENDYTVVLRDGARSITILSPSAGELKYIRAIDMLSSFFREHKNHPGISSIAAARRILAYAK
jgi:hypothetical protein